MISCLNVLKVYKSKRPLKIGFYTQDGFFQAVPACERAVQLAKTALQNIGHEVGGSNQHVSFNRE